MFVESILLVQFYTSSLQKEYVHKIRSYYIDTKSLLQILTCTTLETDRLCFFFRLCTESCIELYQQPSLRTQAIESYTKLIGFMVRSQSNTTAKVTMASQVLSVVVLVLAHHHESQNVHFNQKPFLKLFSSLFIELNNATNRDRKAHRSFITVYR